MDRRGQACLGGAARPLTALAFGSLRATLSRRLPAPPWAATDGADPLTTLAFGSLRATLSRRLPAPPWAATDGADPSD